MDVVLIYLTEIFVTSQATEPIDPGHFFWTGHIWTWVKICSSKRYDQVMWLRNHYLRRWYAAHTTAIVGFLQLQSIQLWKSHANRKILNSSVKFLDFFTLWFMSEKPTMLNLPTWIQCTWWLVALTTNTVTPWIFKIQVEKENKPELAVDLLDPEEVTWMVATMRSYYL